MYVPLEGYDKILELHSQLKSMHNDHWLNYELFTFQWWTMAILMIISWAIWWRLLDRTRTAYIVIYGFFVLFCANGMDAFGITHHLWIYPIKITSVIPHFIPVNWAMLPVIYMLIYQYYPKWKSFLKATFIMSTVFSFVGEPFTEWFGVYYIFCWKYIWSFPLYILIAVSGKWLTESLLALTPRKKTHQNSISDFSEE